MRRVVFKLVFLTTMLSVLNWVYRHNNGYTLPPIEPLGSHRPWSPDEGLTSQSELEADVADVTRADMIRGLERECQEVEDKLDSANITVIELGESQ